MDAGCGLLRCTTPGPALPLFTRYALYSSTLRTSSFIGHLCFLFVCEHVLVLPLEVLLNIRILQCIWPFCVIGGLLQMVCMHR